MGNRLLSNNTLQTYGENPVIGAFRFTANGAAAPLTSTIVGDARLVASFTYAAVGIIQVTMPDAYNKVLYVAAQVDDALAANVTIKTEVVTEGSSNAVYKLRLYDAMGAAVAPGTQSIRVFVVFQNTIGQH